MNKFLKNRVTDLMTVGIIDFFKNDPSRWTAGKADAPFLM